MSAGADIDSENVASAAGDGLQQHTYSSHDASLFTSQLQHGSYSQQPQLQQEQDRQGHSQPDALTQQLHHVLVGETARFWGSTVEPSAQSIFQGTMALQKDAADLSSRAEAEMQGLMAELTRVHRLVASFQDQIRETLSMLQG